LQLGELDLAVVLRVGRNVRMNLLRLLQAMELVEPGGPQEARVRELIRAECWYSLGCTESVISSLRRVLGLGFSHPLVHVAMGYNLYHMALERVASDKGTRQPTNNADDRFFESACREAIAALQRGIANTSFDAEVFWWIGVISETLGDTESAVDAYLRTISLDPDQFRRSAEQRLRQLKLPLGVKRMPLEQQRLDQLGPITDEVIVEARQFLKSCTSFPAFFPKTDSS